MASKTIESANAPAKPPGNTANQPEGLQPFATVQAHEQTQVAVEPRKPLGRPFEFDAEVFAEICERIADGETLVNICERNDDPRMPARSTFRRWMRDREDLRAMYARAREDQAESWSDEIMKIAYDRSGDVVCDREGNEVEDKEFVNRSRIKIDSMKWLMGKVHHRKWGDKIEQNITGNITTQFTIKVGDGSVAGRNEKRVNEAESRVVFNLPQPAKSADEIIEENL